MSELETLDTKSWEALVASPAAVLVIGKSDCEACKAWSAELEAFLAEDRDWQHVRFGKLLIDQPGLVSFKRANAWLAEVDTLPFNVIYVEGQPVKRFAGGGVERLLSRLARVVGPPPAGG
jgi:hypothetical protein